MTREAQGSSNCSTQEQSRVCQTFEDTGSVHRNGGMVTVSPHLGLASPLSRCQWNKKLSQATSSHPTPSSYSRPRLSWAFPKIPCVQHAQARLSCPCPHLPGVRGSVSANSTLSPSRSAKDLEVTNLFPLLPAIQTPAGP